MGVSITAADARSRISEVGCINELLLSLNYKNEYVERIKGPLTDGPFASLIIGNQFY